MIFNKYQTQLTDEILKKLPEEVKDQLLEYINTVPFIINLTSKDRKRAKDLPRDKDGKILVDITHPHILENMNYFRQSAIFFKKNGCYTFLIPNKNPNSPYQKFWKEEIRRCREGYVRQSDGEWVTGLLYFYLNYAPIVLNRVEQGRRAVRIEDFPDMWEGVYWRFHHIEQARQNGKHCIELSRRGCSKSYTLADIMAHNLILGESEKVVKRVITILTAYQKEYLSDKDGTLSKFEPVINFCFTNTPFPHKIGINSKHDMMWQMSYKDSYGRTKGSLNSVMGVSSKDDSDKLRGKRGTILFEEMGTFPNLLAIYDIARHSVEEGDYTFGQIYLVGTSSEEESDFSSAKTLLDNPAGYNIQDLPNVYDKPKQGKKSFGFFFPAYVNRLGCYNEDGVSDVTKALIQILMKRYKAKYSANPKSLLRSISEMPITPAEAIQKTKSNIFPVVQLNTRAAELDGDVSSYDNVYVGDLVITKSGEVKYQVSSDTPIRKWGVDNSTEGALEIYEMPQKDTAGHVFSSRYIIGHDPVDNDQAESSSLSSTYVLDLFTDRIVAEYTGRKKFANDNFELVRRLCIFYNATCLYESNKKGIYAYFSQMNSTHMLADTPEYLRDKNLVKYSSFGSNAKGVNASGAINGYADGLLRDWLLKPVTIQRKNEHNEEVEVTVPNLTFLKSRALIDELVNYDPVRNFDRIRALGMVMLYRQEKIIMYQGDLSKTGEQTTGTGLENDDFFKQNYDDRMLHM